jgi:hypothetical protein
MNPLPHGTGTVRPMQEHATTGRRVPACHTDTHTGVEMVLRPPEGGCQRWVRHQAYR